MFEGFADERVDVGGLSLRVRHAAEDNPDALVAALTAFLGEVSL